jgi:transposase
LVEPISRGKTLNAEHYCDNIFAVLIPICPENGGKKLVLHANNAGTEASGKCRAFCIENDVLLATIPPYSLDFGPSDFFLVAHAKHYLKGLVFSLQSESLAAIQQVLTEIPIENLYAFFEHWIERLEWSYPKTGGYYS